jgi:hypothetical protein
MENWKVKIIDVGYKTALEMYIFRQNYDGSTIHLYSDREEKTEMGIRPAPTLELPHESLQELANVLGAMGIKPQQGFVEGKLEATEKHLEDMRTLVFKK